MYTAVIFTLKSRSLSADPNFRSNAVSVAQTAFDRAKSGFLDPPVAKITPTADNSPGCHVTTSTHACSWAVNYVTWRVPRGVWAERFHGRSVDQLFIVYQKSQSDSEKTSANEWSQRPRCCRLSSRMRRASRANSVIASFPGRRCSTVRNDKHACRYSIDFRLGALF